jgi:hypothetical protein
MAGGWLIDAPLPAHERVEHLRQGLLLAARGVVPYIGSGGALNIGSWGCCLERGANVPLQPFWERGSEPPAGWVHRETWSVPAPRHLRAHHCRFLNKRTGGAGCCQASGDNMHVTASVSGAGRGFKWSKAVGEPVQGMGLPLFQRGGKGAMMDLAPNGVSGAPADVYKAKQLTSAKGDTPLSETLQERGGTTQSRQL